MAFKRKTGKTKVMWLPVTPSTALSANSLVIFSSGKLIAATSTSAAVDTVGVLLKAIASTDTDYASDRLVPVEVPIEKWVEWEADVTATLAATSVGANVDLTDASTVNAGGTTYKIVRITKFLSTTKAWVEIRDCVS